MRAPHVVVLAAYALTFGARPASAQLSSTLDTTGVMEALRAEARATRAPGASIAVVMGDRIAFSAAIGTQSVEAGRR